MDSNIFLEGPISFKYSNIEENYLFQIFKYFPEGKFFSSNIQLLRGKMSLKYRRKLFLSRFVGAALLPLEDAVGQDDQAELTVHEAWLAIRESVEPELSRSASSPQKSQFLQKLQINRPHDLICQRKALRRPEFL